MSFDFLLFQITLVMFIARVESVQLSQDPTDKLDDNGLPLYLNFKLGSRDCKVRVRDVHGDGDCYGKKPPFGYYCNSYSHLVTYCKLSDRSKERRIDCREDPINWNECDTRRANDDIKRPTKSQVKKFPVYLNQDLIFVSDLKSMNVNEADNVLKNVNFVNNESHHYNDDDNDDTDDDGDGDDDGDDDDSDDNYSIHKEDQFNLENNKSDEPKIHSDNTNDIKSKININIERNEEDDEEEEESEEHSFLKKQSN